MVDAVVEGEAESEDEEEKVEEEEWFEECLVLGWSETFLYLFVEN